MRIAGGGVIVAGTLVAVAVFVGARLGVVEGVVSTFVDIWDCSKDVIDGIGLGVGPGAGPPQAASKIIMNMVTKGTGCLIVTFVVCV